MVERPCFSSEPRALVVGGSSGIGRFLVDRLLAAPMEVYVASRNAENTNSLPSKVKACQLDVTDTAQLERFSEECPVFDHVIVCSGSTRTNDGVHGETCFEALVRVNAVGTYNIIDKLFEKNRINDAASIVLIGSICGYQDFKAPDGYTVGKLALRGVLKLLARKLSKRKIRVNMISPGNIYFDGGNWASKLTENPEEVKRLIQSTVLLQRFGKPDDVIESIMFLASEKASFITGADLIVDGGQTTGF